MLPAAISSCSVRAICNGNAALIPMSLIPYTERGSDVSDLGHGDLLNAADALIS